MNYSSLLLNPNKIDFYLDEKEIEILNDAKRNLFKNYYSKALKLIWEAIINNIKRRVKAYGSDEFLKTLNENEKIRYFKKTDSNSKKVELLNNLVLIKTSLNLEIISKKTFIIIEFFYNFTKTCDSNNLKKEELNSIIKLLEINLFKIAINEKIKENQANVILTEFNTFEYESKKEDYSGIKKAQTNFDAKSKALKKEEVLMIHYSKNSKKEYYPLLSKVQIPQRRKEDRIQTIFQNDLDDNEKRNFFYRRRKSDY